MRRLARPLIAALFGAALLGACTSVPYEDGHLKQIPVIATGAKPSNS